MVKDCGVAMASRWGRAGLLLRQANHGEHGNRLVPVPRVRASGPVCGDRRADR